MSTNKKNMETGGEKVKVAENSKLKGQIEDLEREREKLSKELLVFRSNCNPWKICDELKKLGIKEDDGASVNDDSLKTEMRQLKLENQYLKTILENLHRNIIVGEATSHKELKQPEDLMSNKTLTELSTKTQKVTHKFYELETELEYVHGRISELCYMMVEHEGSEVQIPSPERTNKFTAMGRKPRSNPAQATPQTARSLKLDKHLELLSSTLTEMKEKERLQEDTERGTKQSEERLRKLQLLNIENSEMKKEINHLRTRLSEIAGAKLTHENPSTADFSDPNRPVKLAEKYSELYDNQWTDAFSALSKFNDGATDKELTGYLYDILIDGYRFCASVRLRQKKSIEVIMLHPDVNVESSQGRQTEKVNEMFSKLLSDAAKMTSNMTSVNMVKTFLENDEMQKKYGKMMTPCKEYIEECVKLCWLMQIQTPPVYMDLKTAKKQAFQKDTYREYTSKGKYIDFVVRPALFLHEGGPLLAKGIAQGK